MEDELLLEDSKKSLLICTWGYIKQNKTEMILLAISCFFLICGMYLYLYEKPNSQDVQYEENTDVVKKNENLHNIFIDLSGSINLPGVYELKFGARLKEVIEKAGGLSENADIKYFEKNYNLARILVDQEKIYIPSKLDLLNGEEITSSNQVDPKYIQEDSSQQTLININTASLSELDSLPGVGPVISGRIVSSRPYIKIEDLINKKAINASLFEKLKNLIKVN